jgi:hypothetical protein
MTCPWMRSIPARSSPPAAGIIAVNPGREGISMKLKSIAGLFAALLFAFAVIGCSSSSSTPAPDAASPAAAESAAG